MFLCRRSPAADLLTINSPPLSCCGSRQPKLVPVLWTWGAASRDRYDAQPRRWLTVGSKGFTSYNLFKSICRQKRMKQLASPHPTLPTLAGSSRSVEQQIRFLFILTVRSTEVTWTVFRVCFGVFLLVLSAPCQLSEKAGIDRRRHESKELKMSSFCFQDMENKIRSTLNEIYFGKTKDIVNGLR